MLKSVDMPEVIGQIIDTFEDFLEEKGVKIPNEEKQEAISQGEDPESIAILYGSDYGNLEDQIREILENWNLMSDSEEISEEAE